MDLAFILRQMKLVAFKKQMEEKGIKPKGKNRKKKKSHKRSLSKDRAANKVSTIQGEKSSVSQKSRSNISYSYKTKSHLTNSGK